MLKYDSISPFKVERGFLNRTRIYLYPAVVLMKSYRPFLQNLKPNLLCVSYNYNSMILYYDRANVIGIKELIDSLKKNGEYVGDYMYSEDVYAVEICPDLRYGAFESGSYSDLYTKNEIKQIFSPTGITAKVLLRDPEYKIKYVKLLNEWFNSNHTVESLESRPDGSTVPISQFDVPPCLNQEILNYNGQQVVNGGRIRAVKD